MAELDLVALTSPILGDEPCGVDLDAADDIDYMNVTVTAETVLPPSYIVADHNGDRQPFDQDHHYKSLDLRGQIKTVTALAKRTRDLRLLVLLAKLYALSRNIGGFALSLEAIAVVLEEFWEEVHPRLEGGDAALRIETLQRLDDGPLIVTALQYAPLFPNKKLGPLTFHLYMSKLKPGVDPDAEPDTTTLDKSLADDNQPDLAILIGIRETLIGARGVVDRLCRALERIRLICLQHLDYRAPKLAALPELAGKLEALVARVFALTEAAIVRLDPRAGLAPPVEAPLPAETRQASADGPASAPQTPKLAPLALPDAKAAAQGLAAATAYFSIFEPSNPALLLLGQAQALIGKSFLEAMRLLVPEQVEKASINVGTGLVFNLPLTRLAETAGSPVTPPQAAEAKDASEVHPSAPKVDNRSQAVTLLEQVSAFYRAAEPSSPIPLLADRACALAGKDFAALLGDLLPKDAMGKGGNA